MQFVFQLPLIDLRNIVQDVETVNVWPSSDMSKIQIDELVKRGPFIRHFGKVRSSLAGYFCSINCVKFDSPRQSGFRLRNGNVPIFNTFKRVHGDGVYTTRAELGFTDQIESVLKFSGSDESVHISDLLGHYLNMPINVQMLANFVSGIKGNNTNLSNWTTVKFGNLGEVLTKNYYHATLKNKDQPIKYEELLSGEPCITLTFSADEKIVLPANAEKLDDFVVDDETIQLFGYKFGFQETTIKVWIFQLPRLELIVSQKAIQELHNRRMNLFRLNSEKETVRVLANRYDLKNPDAKVTKYIEKTPVKILKKKRFSASQDSIRDFALQSAKDNLLFTQLALKQVLDEYGLANINTLRENMAKGPLKKSILFITSNPTDVNPFDFGEQFKNIGEALDSGRDREYFELLKIETGVERGNVMKILYKSKPDYIHITLHNSNIKGLYFQDASRKPDPMSVEEFADCMKDLYSIKKPEVVVLCACNSLAHASAAKQYCDYAIGTNYVFPDTAAIVYANKFYEALFNGQQINFCHTVAIKGIKYYSPPFDPIEDNEVYNILQLL